MKKIIIYLLLIIPFIAFSQPENNIPFEKQVSVLNSNSKFGITNTKVFKRDSIGNFEWIRNFSGKIDLSSADTNLLTGIAFDGNLIYVQVIQGNFSSLTHYPSWIILDTLGNVRVIRYGFNVFSSTTGLEGFGCMPSYTGGAWLIYRYNNGISSVVHSIKVDSAGLQVASSPEIQFQTFNRLRDYCSLPDSTYLLMVTTSIPPSVGNIGLVKMDDNGNVVWGKLFSDSGAPSSSIEPYQTEVDHSGNIYIFGDFLKRNVTSLRGNFGLKLNKSGSILIQKEWENSGYDINDLALVNDSLLLIFSPSFTSTTYYSTTFDTLLNSVCFDPPFPPGISAVQHNIFNSSFNTLRTDISSFAPSIDTSLTLINNVYSNYCFVLSDNRPIISRTDLLTISPIPAHDQISLQCYSGKEISKISIFDLNGKLLIEAKDYQPNSSLQISELKAGLYIVHAEVEHSVFYSKLIVQ